MSPADIRRFADLIDLWPTLVPLEYSLSLELTAFNRFGALHFTIAPELADTVDLGQLGAALLACLPETLDGVRVRRIVWRRRGPTRPTLPPEARSR